MSQDSKHPASALSVDRRGLLHELDDVHSLLGKADSPEPLDIPLLEPEGDTHTQISLLGGEQQPAPAPTPVARAIAERENPFLPRATMERLAHHHRQTPAAPVPTLPMPLSATDTPALDDRTMRALVDELLAAWMPRIERELRQRLLEQLRGEDD